MTIHDMRVFDLPDTFALHLLGWTRVMLRILARKALKLITVSQFSKERMLTWFEVSEKSVEVIPNGVNREQFYPAAPHEIHETLAHYQVLQPYFLAFGAGAPHKNLDFLTDVWRKTGLAQRGFSLVTTGNIASNLHSSPPDRDSLGLKRLTEVKEQHLPALYSGATAYLFPSRYEGFGLPALEAMACGTPVAASRAGALPEVVADAGMLLPPADGDAWIDSIRELADNAGWRSMLSQLGARRAAEFDWDRTAELTLKVLQRAAA
ncbi:MAG: glycosyltransferase family 4 protein [Chloroflexi bacterium]|nr:glycosyltransferase family 4 protein [Chloroflexota bacterium]